MRVVRKTDAAQVGIVRVPEHFVALSRYTSAFVIMRDLGQLSSPRAPSTWSAERLSGISIERGHRRPGPPGRSTD